MSHSTRRQITGRGTQRTSTRNQRAVGQRGDGVDGAEGVRTALRMQSAGGTGHAVSIGPVFQRDEAAASHTQTGESGWAVCEEHPPHPLRVDHHVHCNRLHLQHLCRRHGLQHGRAFGLRKAEEPLRTEIQTLSLCEGRHSELRDPVQGRGGSVFSGQSLEVVNAETLRRASDNYQGGDREERRHR